MGKHVDAADDTELSDPPEAASPEQSRESRSAECNGASGVSDQRYSSSTHLVMAAGATIVIVLGAMAAWLGCRAFDERRDNALRAEFVEAASQGAVNLTTIDAATVDTDVQRILDSSTGTFHDDFGRRAQPFIEVVRKAQSKSVGTVTSAALESQDGDQAQVLVTVSMTMTNPGLAEQQPAQGWRMRIGVQKTGDTTKLSNVEFVT